MTGVFAVRVRTALSPEWDRGFDEAFTELITADSDWVRDEFDALIDANWNDPPAPPALPAPSTGRPEPSRSPAGSGQTMPAPPSGPIPADPDAAQRSPP